MDLPPEIAFRQVEPTDALKRIIQDGIDSLDKVHPRLTSCRVMVEEASRGVPHVRLDIGIPGNDLVVNREAPHNPANHDLVLCSQSLFRFADLGDDGLCRGGPDKGCGVIVSAIDVVVDRLD